MSQFRQRLNGAWLQLLIIPSRSLVGRRLYHCHRCQHDTVKRSKVYKGKGKRQTRQTLDIAPLSEGTLLQRYDTRCRGISQFYLPPMGLSTNRMNYTCFCLPSRSWSSFPDPRGTER